MDEDNGCATPCTKVAACVALIAVVVILAAVGVLYYLDHKAP